jgi:hypothetical protein
MSVSVVEMDIVHRDRNDFGTGKEIGRRQHKVTIERFQGEKAITQLPVCPMRYLPGNSELKEKLTEKGKAYRKYIEQGYSHYKYDGSISIMNPILGFSIITIA